MRTAILDPFSGISGDMTLGALIGVGLNPEWLRALPSRMGLAEVGVEIREVLRGEIVCWKVDFDIPPQPHGRHIDQIRELVAASDAPAQVRERAERVFWSIAAAEGEIHGLPPSEVHLHEVGAVDAILDVVGGIWGFSELGVEDVRCGVIRTGDGTVRAAHGILPVPAPNPLARGMNSAGGAPVDSSRTSAAPVGVTSSPAPSGPGLTRCPSSSLSVAGAGTGSMP